jgi:hypothetical protein
MVDLLDSPAEVERFFQEHPNSLVLVIEDSTDRIFAGNESAWQSRILRELRVGSHLYVVVGGPQQGQCAGGQFPARYIRRRCESFRPFRHAPDLAHATEFPILYP